MPWRRLNWSPFILCLYKINIYSSLYRPQKYIVKLLAITKWSNGKIAVIGYFCIQLQNRNRNYFTFSSKIPGLAGFSILRVMCFNMIVLYIRVETSSFIAFQFISSMILLVDMKDNYKNYEYVHHVFVGNIVNSVCT